MKNALCWVILLATLSGGCKQERPETCTGSKNELRPPAYPLITIDPYTSGWATADNLYDGSVKHWTGRDFPLIGALRVDNAVYRFMGVEETQMEPVAPTSEQGGWTGKYVTSEPPAGWMKPGFNDAAWSTGKGAFGTMENEYTARTQWGSERIWVRRTVRLESDGQGKKIYLDYSHDDDVILYINGIEVVNTGNACKKNVLLPLPDEVAATLKKGDNLLAAYCRNRGGNALLDFGLVTEKDVPKYLAEQAVQTSVDVQATQTRYVFRCGTVDLKLTFTAPLLMENLEWVSRPVNYITYEVAATDGKKHDVQIYFEASPAWALDAPLQPSVSESFEANGLRFLKTGSVDQKILGKKGDDVRIDWGYFYLAAAEAGTSYGVGDAAKLRSGFVEEGELPGTGARAGNARTALVRSLGNVQQGAGYIMLGYDDVCSVQYFGENLRPYWNRKGDRTIEEAFAEAAREYGDLLPACSRFDTGLMETATQAGGKEYASLCALAYRQAVSAHKLAEAPDGSLLFLSKENFSNGSIGTVDITYPSAPLFLYYNPGLAKGLLNHIFYYSESGKWTKPFPAHDIGTYPLANGQTYGGDMPVEEAGNMLIVTAAIAAMEGNAAYAAKHWPVLTVWADYLLENGLDPDNQLCTDDFAGHFAHNANLSVKAILAVASYGKLAGMLDKRAAAQKYTARAKEMARKWMEMACDGDHYRLTFDKAGTWSQKYNLVWDELLGLGIFPPEVKAKELAYYQTKQNTYGLPLDNREAYTKTDWIIWTATLADDPETFRQFVAPVYRFMNETTDRVPMSDWVWTDKPNQRGFQARSVVGGYFIKMLHEKMRTE